MFKGIKKKGITVIVCCYNSARFLPETLWHLSKQVTSKNIEWEIIIINNNSSDNTSELAVEIWKNLGQVSAFKVVDQPIPGLSYAREKGFETAAYEYIIMCDDDNWLNSNYLQLAFDIMENSPKIGILGGIGEAVFEGDQPAWFENVKGQYATGPQAQTSGDLSNSKRYVFGAGAVLRYSAYAFIKKNGFKSLLTDRKGKELSSGGDNEICYVLLLSGFKVWYDERLKFKHYLINERLTWDYLSRLNNAFALTAFYLRPYTYFFSKNPSIRSFIWLRDLRYLLKSLSRIAWDYSKMKKGNKEAMLQRILLKSQLNLIKIYLEKRGDLDAAIIKIGELVENFNRKNK